MSMKKKLRMKPKNMLKKKNMTTLALIHMSGLHLRKQR